MNFFIYTQKEEVYEALKALGFGDMGKMMNSNQTLYLVSNDPCKTIPPALQKDCVLSDRMMFGFSRTVGEGGD